MSPPDSGASSGSGSGSSGSPSGGADAGPGKDGGTDGGAGGRDGGLAPLEAGTLPQGTVRLMPLGDSITGSTCWRALLWQKLSQNGLGGRFNFVGSRSTDAGCTPSNYNRANEGHPGVLVTNFVNDADELVAGIQTPQSLFSLNPADVVLFHFATNDIWNSVADSTILAAYSQVLAALRAVNPKVVVLVAQLIPMNPINTATCSTCACPACGGRVVAFNSLIPRWASSSSTPASPVIVVDQWTGFDATAGVDTVDGVHPNALSGAPKMANKWYDALVPLL
jgi:lysophospholipase L1-like esterase